ncbi:hypothetical protein T11_464 [Trichinella zimbabwensis]|uniref:Uncharacterized protein n=1 Tax=Trichinella zimbabwensis TaxID=268475 RepID=A0A0V1HF40_9BILA|nr:hypothetical protein T11_464 [Trichinella zimbabwensis]
MVKVEKCCQICPMNVYDQIIQDSFQVREINYSKLRLNQNTGAKRLAQMYSLLIFRYGLDDTNSNG